MDVEITTLGGDTYLLSEYDVQARDFNVSSIDILSYSETIEGRDGYVDYGAVYGSRRISVPIFMRVKDMLDYPLLRDELFAITSGRRPVYLRELRKPTDKRPCPDMPDDKDGYVGSKRYLARLTDVVELDQQGLYGFGELVFETTELPYAESILTTSAIDRHGLNYGDGWSYGMGLLYDDESHKYTHTGTSFRIYNAGNVPVHPFEQDLKI